LAERRTEPVVVIGLGRFGSSLAQKLVARGTEVLAIDNDPKLVQAMAGKLPHVLTADCTDPDALRELGVDEFRHAVVAIGTDLQASILTTSLLAELGVPDIWGKAISAQHGNILARVGAHHVVAPEHDMGERVAHVLSSRVLEYVELDDDFAMIKTRPPQAVVGVPLGDSDLGGRYGVAIVAVRPEHPPAGRPPGFTVATPDTVVAAGDLILALGPDDALDRFTASD
jgi:trk system potassium uptake protein TrkA